MNAESIASRLRSPRFPAILWAVVLVACLWNMAIMLLDYTPRRDLRVLPGWDENLYYAWAHSPVVDGDFDFRNEVRLLASLRGGGEFSAEFAAILAATPPTATGLFPNKYGIGTAIAGAPGVLLARAAVLLRGADSVHPFASIYAVGYGASLVIGAFIGLALAWRLLRRLGHGSLLSTTAVALVFLGTPLGYYIWFDPYMAHATGFLALTAYFFVCLRWRDALSAGRGRRALTLAAAMGALLGFAFMVRYPNAMAALFPIGVAAGEWLGADRAGRGRILRQYLACVLPAGAAMFAASVPQLLAWKLVYGEYVLYSYTGEKISLLPIHALQVLAGSSNSILLWSPLAVPALAGLALLRGPRRGIALGAAAVLVAFLWVYGSWDFYALGSAFGMRGFVDLSALWMIGLAETITWARGHGKAGRAVLAAVGLCIGWNLWMVGAVRANVQSSAAPFAGTALVTEAPAILRRWRTDAGNLTKLRHRRFPLFTPAGALPMGAE